MFYLHFIYIYIFLLALEKKSLKVGNRIVMVNRKPVR